MLHHSIVAGYPLPEADQLEQFKRGVQPDFHRREFQAQVWLLSGYDTGGQDLQAWDNRSFLCTLWDLATVSFALA